MHEYLQHSDGVYYIHIEAVKTYFQAFYMCDWCTDVSSSKENCSQSCLMDVRVEVIGCNRTKPQLPS